MPETLHVLLGAHGDICAMLPWMKAEAERTGRPVQLLVGKEYAPMFDGVSYVSPISLPGDFTHLGPALRFLKADLPGLPIKVLQWQGRMDDRCLTSFVHEMWYQAGALLQFGKLPLVFDRRDTAREGALVKRIQSIRPPQAPRLGRRRSGAPPSSSAPPDSTSNKPMILVATKGRSSPFKHAVELMKCIRAEFGKTHQIVDLSRVKAHRIYDLLGLYDAAVALVSIDTVHLHLSRASRVPVFALARDYPQLWDGVPWEARYRFYCRYGTWRRRKEEMLEAMRAVVSGQWAVGSEQSPAAISELPPRSYNPSIISRGHLGTLKDYIAPLYSARIHPVANWKTRIILSNGTGIKPLKFPGRFAGYSQEDMRLFNHGGRVLASYTLAKMVGRRQARCVTGYAELVEEDDCWRVRRHHQPKHGRNRFNGMEKNWVFFQGKDEGGGMKDEGNLFAIYGIVGRQQIVLELDGDDVRAVHKSKAPRWNYGEIRGGVVLPFDEIQRHPTAPSPAPGGGQFRAPAQQRPTDPDLVIRFFHSRTAEPGPIPWRYHIGALLMEALPPFRVVRVMEKPIISGNEEWLPGCNHWKPNVVFPCGAVHSSIGYLLSIGVNDAFSRQMLVQNDLFKL